MFDVKKQSTIAIGPWIVEAEQCDIQGEEKETALKQKAVPSMTQLMQGFVEYYLEVPTLRQQKVEDQKLYSPAPLIFAPSFNKDTRPPAWKKADEKIQEVLPLLGNSINSARALKTSNNPVAVVRITLDRRFSSG